MKREMGFRARELALDFPCVKAAYAGMTQSASPPARIVEGADTEALLSEGAAALRRSAIVLQQINAMLARAQIS